MGKTYRYDSVVTLGDTDLTGHLNFSNIFQLQGRARDLWIRDCVDQPLPDLVGGLRLVIQEASTRFIREFKLFDPVQVELQFTAIESACVVMRFRCVDPRTGVLHSEGRQTLVFMNHLGHITRMPTHWREAAHTYADFGEQAVQDVDDQHELGPPATPTALH
ncbi:acyl-CoA thioesterase [Deinococcus oregonensis]|uniref:Acyl-CoA thioesterase n=1 Tax=Deinococcus oregonensis TaxID=1805970 RepID=A0ABV6ATK0_9DEIO